MRIIVNVTGFKDLDKNKHPQPQIKSIFHPTAYTFEDMQRIKLALIDYHINSTSMQELTTSSLLEYIALQQTYLYHLNGCLDIETFLKFNNEYENLAQELREGIYWEGLGIDTSLLRFEVSLKAKNLLMLLFRLLANTDLLMPIKYQEHFAKQMSRALLQTI